ncbi:hypothetical protein [Cytophaga hutchinsonii]|uniref:hypothetical protein n=1 Tax=Cytophaga hutchinsonii TaxID=985 RepID=UPI00003C88A8|nr:hypothetical protein [Cytophaga hutchinsonii]SFX50332.1 hypothetical protein SAMN04487930_1052 [Cytophaga hutchinsonii ATCC 33406]
MDNVFLEKVKYIKISVVAQRDFPVVPPAGVAVIQQGCSVRNIRTIQTRSFCVAASAGQPSPAVAP